MLRAQREDISSISSLSTIERITSRTSYTLRAASGTKSAGSCDGTGAGSPCGGVSPACCGRCASSSRTSPTASWSLAATNWHTPFFACTFGPPSSWASTSSPVTSRTTPGPVRNIAEPSVMTTKSVSAGEYAPPPADTPGDHRDLRHLPGQLHALAEDAAVAAERGDAVVHPRAARGDEADDRHARAARELHHAHDRVGVRLAERAAGERLVLRVAVHRPARDRPGGRHDAVALAHPLRLAPWQHGRADHVERSRVAEKFEPIPAP